MSLWESFVLALKNIAASKMRALLTMLGIIIGIGAVMLIVGIGAGLERYMTDSFAELGTNTINVTLFGRGSSRTVSEEDMYQFMAENTDTMAQISPTVTLSDTVKIGTETMDYTAVTGVSEAYLDIKGFDVGVGRPLAYIDVAQRKNVCLVGNYLAENYYDGDAIGNTIKVGDLKLTIVGVMEQEADDMTEGGSDDCIFVPYTTAARQSMMSNINSYVITVVDEQKVTENITIIEDFLYSIYGSEAYMVMSLSQVLDMMNDMLDVVVTILSAIAAISLVVGGIGIMNIMLVSVTERTREIGIRKALGSKERYILQQFVIEAATTSAIGGVFGIALGYGMSAAATAASEAMLGTPIHVSPGMDAVVLAVGVSIGIGILFGYLPAQKAARLNPIDALRYD